MASQVSKRRCPCCNVKPPRTVRTIFEDVVRCCDCGMVYANTAKTQADYDSYYSQPGRYTAEWSAWNYRRYVNQAERILRLGVNRDASVVDIGCGAGGLVTALLREGYTNVIGVDPAATPSTYFYSELPPGHYDLAILSHVLEHVLDVDALLERLARCAKSIYVEVPDARRYHLDEVSPYQQFNEEHINHFSMTHLLQLLSRHNFTVRACGESSCDPNKFPVVWAHAEFFTTESSGMVDLYCDKSASIMATLEKQISVIECPVICWGIGALARRLEPLLSGKVVGATDARSGGKFCDKPVLPASVEWPSSIPILVTTILHKDSVMKQIAELGLKNPVITLGA